MKDRRPYPTALPSSPALVRLRRTVAASAFAVGLGPAACDDDGGTSADVVEDARDAETAAETTDTFIAPQPPPTDTTEGFDVIPPQPPPTDTSEGFDAIPPQPPPSDTSDGPEVIPPQPPPQPPPE